MHNLLITGGAGFIGSNFVRLILEQRPGVRVINLDALTYAGRRENLEDLPGAHRHQLIEGDIRDRALLEQLFRDHEIDTVVHFAAESHVDRSILGPEAFVETNVRGTFTLLEAARGAWLTGAAPTKEHRFHHVSTDEVYGDLGANDPPFQETTAYDPHSPYSASKAASDHLVRAYARTYGLRTTISNCSNNYGPYQFPEKLIPLVLLNAICGIHLPLYGDGKQVRDWLYVTDHCEAILEILERGEDGATYNIGGANQPTNLEIVTTLCGILDELLPSSPHRPHADLIRYVPDRPGHDRRYAMDITKISRELGWRPRHDLRSGLDKTVRWYLDHRTWLERVSERSDFQRWMDHNYTAR